MLVRRDRLRMHAAVAVAFAGVAIVATGGPGGAAAPSRPDSFGGDAAASAVHYTLDRNPSAVPAVEDAFHAEVPYAVTSIDSSGGASARAASVFPGDGPLGAPALICLFAAQLCSAIPGGFPDYPLLASAQYPSRPDSAAPASQKPVGAGPFSLTPHGVTAHADPNRVEAAAVTAAASTPVISVQSATAHSVQTFQGSTLVLSAESVVKGVAVGGGALRIDQLRSLATARVDGGRVSAASAVTTVSGATLAGTPVTIDSTGVHAAGKGDNGAVNRTVNTALRHLASTGISVRSLGVTRLAKRGVANATTGGLLITFNQNVALPAPLPPQVPVSPEGDYFGSVTLAGAGASAFATPAVPLGGVSLSLPPAGAAGQQATQAGGGALPGAATTASGAQSGAAPAVVGPAARRPVALLGLDLTTKRVRMLMLVLLAYPLLVLLGAPLRAPSRFPRLR